MAVRRSIKIDEDDRGCTLSEIMGRVRSVINNTFSETYWIKAETSDVRINTSSGHCYLEFIEKSEESNQIIARARGYIWAKVFRLLKPYFEMETNQVFGSGIKVLVKVSLDFHELYGFSLNVLDIDPSYTVGDMVRKKMEIIRRLKDEGVFTLNKELCLPDLPQKIAVITSPTAAGYEDFVNQLENNKSGYPFYIKLFPALMQGDKTEESVIAALDRIYENYELFDVVVIIRGGGATSDLNSFDSYLLAASCAQFPLPILTGIGHERDDTVVDMVAHTRLKTPTAVAAFLLDCIERQAEELESLQRRMVNSAVNIISSHQNFIKLLSNRFPERVINRIERNRGELNKMAIRLPSVSSSLLLRQDKMLELLQNKIIVATERRKQKELRFLELTEQFIKMVSPEYILKKGYNITMVNGRIIKSAKEVSTGETLTVFWSDGSVNAKVENKFEN